MSFNALFHNIKTYEKRLQYHNPRYTVDVYKPGNTRLYKLVESGDHGETVQSFCCRLPSKEFRCFLDGFLTGLQEKDVTK